MTAMLVSMKLSKFLVVLCLQMLAAIIQARALTITGGHCEKNVSVKYQIPITKTRYLHRRNTNADISNFHQNNSNDSLPTEQYVEYEDRIRWDTVQICCPGYRTIIFGFCEPICEAPCPPFSYCAEPNKCSCIYGYEPSHHPNKEHQLICRPICVGGCPDHSHCVAHNKCECRAGYKDVSLWFYPVQCERIPCAADQRYDIERRSCVKIDMSIEEMMQRIGEKLSKGLDITDAPSMDMESDEDQL